MGLEVLHEEAGGDGLGPVSTDVDEPARSRVNYHDQERNMPEGDVGESDVREDEANECRDGNYEHQCHKSAVLDWVIVSHELIIGVANLGTLPCRVAIGDAGKVDVGVDISSD
jgi:hypothetical protein